MSPGSKHTLHQWSLILLATVTLTVGHWAAVSLEATVEHWAGKEWWTANHAWLSWSLFGAFALLFGYSYIKHGPAAPIRDIHAAPAVPCRALVLPVSRSPSVQVSDAADGGLKIDVTAGQGTWSVDLPLELTGNLAAVVSELDGKRWSWQQLLRGIQPHLDTISRIYMVFSDGPQGSAAQSSELIKLLRFVLPGGVGLISRPATGGVDFESFNSLTEALTAIVELEEHQHGTAATKITVDCTGGQASTSVAVAAVTLSRSTNLQYVSTNSGKVLGFKLIHEHHPALGE